MNLLVNFKLDGEEVMTWAMEIDKLVPNEELRKLPFILDCFKTTELEYKPSEGIRNIFSALKMVYEEEGKFKIRKAIW